jgi:putative hydrolase of the HAD superfamily
MLQPSARKPLDHVETWVFDLDNTLYPASCGVIGQMEVRIDTYMVEVLNLPPERIDALRHTYRDAHGSTMNGLMAEYGMAPEGFFEYVHEIDLSVIPPNVALDAALARLEGRKLIFTNATVRHAENVMAHLGIARHFDDVYDAEAADYIPKPMLGAYENFLRRYDIAPRRAAMIEDMTRNLVPAATLGMTTVWVRNDRPNAHSHDHAEHIHHTVDDLAVWLGSLASETGD